MLFNNKDKILKMRSETVLTALVFACAVQRSRKPYTDRASCGFWRALSPQRKRCGLIEVVSSVGTSNMRDDLRSGNAAASLKSRRQNHSVNSPHPISAAETLRPH
jgi:hypothetical protein